MSVPTPPLMTDDQKKLTAKVLAVVIVAASAGVSYLVTGHVPDLKTVMDMFAAWTGT